MNNPQKQLYAARSVIKKPRSVTAPRISFAPDSLAWAMLTAAACVTEVVAYGRSLTVVLAKLRQQSLPENAVRSQAIDLTYATLRRYSRGDVELSVLLDRPTAEDELRSLLRVALCWLEMHPERAYVGVDQAVEAAATLSAGRYRGFVNAILRRALRVVCWIKRLPMIQRRTGNIQGGGWNVQTDWPDNWQEIAAGGNRKPPMGLRVNRQATRVDDYVQQLSDADRHSTATCRRGTGCAASGATGSCRGLARLCPGLGGRAGHRRTAGSKAVRCATRHARAGCLRCPRWQGGALVGDGGN